ncbi:A24 family peptidase [Streptomyces sp. NPDC089919]|uniref:A24 family peptidase n=1 Tax=Streptomyces sp. NPDC089919 TaxID=3155188 RepID=UPI00343F7493
MDSLLAAAPAAGYGAGAGRLLPRMAYRLAVEPGEPWRSDCPQGHPLPGWFGTARCQGRPYGPGPRRTAVLTAVVCALLAGAAGAVPEAAVWALLAPCAVLLALVDRAVHRLPDVLTLPLGAAAVALLGAAALLPGAAGSWRGALLGGLLLGAGYLTLFLVHPEGMGFGDVKLALPLGVALGWYGWGVLLAGAFLGFLYGALYGLALVLRGRAGRRTALPFGPFMAAGAFTALFLGGLGA